MPERPGIVRERRRTRVIDMAEHLQLVAPADVDLRTVTACEFRVKSRRQRRRSSTMRRILPMDRSMVSGPCTTTAALTPIVFLISVPS